MDVMPAPLRGYQRSWLARDVVAGLTLSAVAIPEVMGYTSIAQTPIVTGLYTVIFPTLVFALLGSSRLLVVGADSATAAVLAAGLSGLGVAGLAPGSEEWVAYASLTALVCGGLLVLARLLRLGFIGDFLSASVLIGFLTGVGIQVLSGQIPGVLGIPKGSGNWFEQQWHWLSSLSSISVTTFAFGLSTHRDHPGLRALPAGRPGRHRRGRPADHPLGLDRREGARCGRRGRRAGRLPADRPAVRTVLVGHRQGAADCAVLLRAHHRPERRHLPQLRVQARRLRRHQPGHRRAGRCQRRRRSERHLRGQRQPHQDADPRRSEGPHPARQHDDGGRGPGLHAVPHRPARGHAHRCPRRDRSPHRRRAWSTYPGCGDCCVAAGTSSWSQ